MAAVLEDLKEKMKTSGGTAALKFVTLTYAQSLDGSIAAVQGAPLRLSGDQHEQSMRMTHELRAMHDAIVVGIGTVLADNPSLTVRLVPGNSPQPVVIDSRLRCPCECKLMTAETGIRPIILTNASKLADPEVALRRTALEAGGATIIGCEADADGHVNLADAFSRLPLHCASIMVEGGASIISSLLMGCATGALAIDYILLTIAPTLVGGLHAVQQLLPHDASGRFPRLSHIKVDVLDGADVVIGGHL